MLTFVPTPIGNLGDLSFRSLEVLKDAELILCEDTRITKRLLYLITQKQNITFPDFQFKSIHSHNEKAFLTDETKEILSLKNVVYLSDAGMPCISDPGALLVEFCIQYKIQYDILPGANALLTAYAMSGFNQKEFIFFGFLPHKGKDRANQLQHIMQHHFITILYESPHRLLKLIDEIVKLDTNRKIFVVKELTKVYQQSFKGYAKDIKIQLEQNEIKGEWVVIIDNLKYQGEMISLQDIQELDLPPKQKAKLISKLTGQNTKEVYKELLE